MHNLTYLDIKILSRKKAGNSIRFCITLEKTVPFIFPRYRRNKQKSENSNELLTFIYPEFFYSLLNHFVGLAISAPSSAP